MTTLEFEGATDNITENQFKFMGEVLEKRGIKNKKVTIKFVGVAGDNYMSYVRRLIVPNAYGKPLKLIAKIAPHTEIYRMAAMTFQSFENEHVMYTEVLPKFQNMQFSAKVPNKGMLRFAKCYRSSIDAPNELILLEDLDESNFIMLDRFKSLSNECIKAVLRNFSIFHSLSFALKYTEPETFESIKQKLHDIMLIRKDMPESKHFVEATWAHAVQILSSDERRLEEIKRIPVKDLNYILYGVLKDDIDSKHSVILQGDAWINNLMFKFDGDILLESIFIDYQMSRVANPVRDLMFTIFLCADHHTITKHYNEWIDYYHTELDKALSTFDLNANIVYPKKQLDADLKRHGTSMFTFCIHVSKIFSIRTEDAARCQENMDRDVDMIEMIDKVMVLDSTNIFRGKIEGLVDSFVQLDLI